MCVFVWTWNSGSARLRGRARVEGVLEQGADEEMWTKAVRGVVGGSSVMMGFSIRTFHQILLEL